MLTIVRVAKKFLASYNPEGSLPCSRQSATELHSEPAKPKFFFNRPNNICLYFRHFVRAQESTQIPGFKRVVLEV
jgi:hypothetical protein